MDFNKLNEELYQLSAPHRFAKTPDEIDRGYLKISNWLGDLCYHFEKKRKQQENFDEDEFKSLLNQYREKIMELDESPYREGLIKAIEEVK